ncbi:Tat pathway signal protein [Bacteroides heparinolyticus]|uniref:Tat pathway signal protein n=1 Tax=Prevotella heparinolytica TaxID=28113 RepID=UPI0023F65B60|nr:Tat pathway signal protein [Bacteroides heparinolyticus]MCI6213794.1 Tat pathway signal protein [Bacteroides heparinolyticus]
MKEQLIWGCLIHLSFNMWEEYIWPGRPFRGYRPDLELSETLWKDAINLMGKSGVNMVVIDLGDAVKYKCHPEIAVNNAWTVARLKQELHYIRSLGMEPIPKLNFSAGHDTWMKEYSKMVSTDEYYRFCSDMIAEVCEIFNHPRLFHIGMDEEGYLMQSTYKHVVVRKNEAWWHDFLFLVKECEHHRAKAWLWPDYMLWHHPDQFFSRMPKTVMQSNWYYDEEFNPEWDMVRQYIDLEKHGYDQILTGSYHYENPKSIGNTVAFAEQYIGKQHLKGFLQTWWKPTVEENRERILRAVSLIGEARKAYNDRHP